MSTNTKETKIVRYEIPNQLPVVGNNTDLNRALAELKAKGFNVLVPQAYNFSNPMLKVGLELVFIDPEVDETTWNGRDVYSMNKGRTFTLHYRAANKIAGAANIEWTDSRVVRRDVDENNQVVYVEHQVAWQVRKPNGGLKKGITTGYYRYAEDQVRFDKRPDQVRMRRHFAEALAESNAKYRAIFDALEQVPREMTREEISRPFVVPVVIEDINELIKDDPDAKKMLLAHKLGISSGIFGGTVRTQEIQVVEEKAEQKPQQVEPAEVTVSHGVTKDKYIEFWSKRDVNDRKQELQALLQSRNEVWPSRAAFETLPVERQIDAMWYYFNLPESGKAHGT